MNDFYRKSINNKKLSTILLTKNTNYKSNKTLSNLNLKNSKFISYSNNKNNNYMNSGIYYFKRKILKIIVNKKISLENEIMPRLIKTNKISAEISKGPFLDIGTKKNLKKANSFLKRNFKNKAVLLDRDGVIIEDKGYVEY